MRELDFTKKASESGDTQAIAGIAWLLITSYVAGSQRGSRRHRGNTLLPLASGYSRLPSGGCDFKPPREVWNRNRPTGDGCIRWLHFRWSAEIRLRRHFRWSAEIRLRRHFRWSAEIRLRRHFHWSAEIRLRRHFRWSALVVYIHCVQEDKPPL